MLFVTFLVCGVASPFLFLEGRDALDWSMQVRPRVERGIVNVREVLSLSYTRKQMGRPRFCGALFSSDGRCIFTLDKKQDSYVLTSAHIGKGAEEGALTEMRKWFVDLFDEPIEEEAEAHEEVRHMKWAD